MIYDNENNKIYFKGMVLNGWKPYEEISIMLSRTKQPLRDGMRVGHRRRTRRKRRRRRRRRTVMIKGMGVVPHVILLPGSKL